MIGKLKFSLLMTALLSLVLALTQTQANAAGRKDKRPELVVAELLFGKDVSARFLKNPKAISTVHDGTGKSRPTTTDVATVGFCLPLLATIAKATENPSLMVELSLSAGEDKATAKISNLYLRAHLTEIIPAFDLCAAEQYETLVYAEQRAKAAERNSAMRTAMGAIAEPQPTKNPKVETDVAARKHTGSRSDGRLNSNVCMPDACKKAQAY